MPARSGGYPARAALKLDADRRADGAERGDGGRQDLPPEHAPDAPPEHEPTEDQPAEAVDPAEHELGVLGEAADPHHQQRREDRGLDARVDSNAVEVPHRHPSLREARGAIR